MKCFDCGEEAGIVVRLVHGEFPFLCRRCFLKRRKTNNWDLTEVVK